MALNYKSYQFTSTSALGIVPITCTTTSCLVRSATVYNSTSSTLTCESLVQKSGQTSFLKFNEFYVAAGETKSLLIEPVVLENGDSLRVVFGGTGMTLFISYVESTAVLNATSVKELSDWSATTPQDGQIPVWDNTAGEYVPTTSGASINDTSQLPEQSTGTEPYARYMRGFNALDTLTNAGSDSAAVTMDSSPDAIVFVAENTNLPIPKPMKVTFGDIMAAIVTRGVQDLVNSGIGSIEDYTFGNVVGDFNGDGEVGSGDLLEFLVVFGTSWASNSSAFFQPTTVYITNTAATSVTATTIVTSQVLSFAASDVTSDGGTQNVTLSTNTIRIAEQGSPYDIDVVQNKQLSFTFFEGGMTFDIEEANTQVTVYASISMYDVYDNQLGSTVLVPVISALHFSNAGTNIALAQAYNYETNNASLGSVSGASGGLDVEGLSYIEVQLKALTNGGAVSISIEVFEMKLRISN